MTGIPIPQGPMGEALMVADGMCPACGGRLERVEIGLPGNLLEVGACGQCILYLRVSTRRPAGEVVLERYSPVGGQGLVPVPRRILGGFTDHLGSRS